MTSARTVQTNMELRVAAEERDEEGVRAPMLSAFVTSVGGREREGKKRKERNGWAERWGGEK